MSPNQPKTPIRGVRIPEKTWKAAQDKAAAEGRNVSDVVRKCLESYIKDEGKK